jgi:class 3 adenylate cyclase
MIDLRFVGARLAAVGRYPDVSPAHLDAFRAALLAEDDWGLYRINPPQFAERHGLPPAVALDLFVLGAREGLFDLTYLEVCPWCGGVTHELAALGKVAPAHFDCQMCRVEVDSALDDHVAVAFSLSEHAGKLQLDPHRDARSYGRYHFFSAWIAGEKVQAYVGSLPMGFARVPARGEASTEMETAGYPELFVASFTAARSLSVPVQPGAPLEVTVTLGGEAPVANQPAVGPGRVRVQLRSTASEEQGALLMARDVAALYAAVGETPPRFAPYVTARELLSLQRFREVYRLQELPQDLKLRIKSLTLLFTDLSGSTALYESTGDVTAFDIVREHFHALTDCVRRNGGAVVKTMGDAVMASFTRPTDAVAAAAEMLDAMEPVTERAARYGHQLGLKVGIHQGAALVVTADERLDYFGQSVNVAARVQGLAGPGELWLTAPVYASTGDALRQAGFVPSPRQVPLKGVEGLVDVVACARA